MSFPTVPFYARHLCIDKGSLQDLAAQRVLPPAADQRRDGEGQFVSHKDIPEAKQQKQ